MQSYGLPSWFQPRPWRQARADRRHQCGGRVVGALIAEVLAAEGTTNMVVGVIAC
jgi:hypothetical protein